MIQTLDCRASAWPKHAREYQDETKHQERGTNHQCLSHQWLWKRKALPEIHFWHMCQWPMWIYYMITDINWSKQRDPLQKGVKVSRHDTKILSWRLCLAPLDDSWTTLHSPRIPWPDTTNFSISPTNLSWWGSWWADGHLLGIWVALLHLLFHIIESIEHQDPGNTVSLCCVPFHFWSINLRCYP